MQVLAWPLREACTAPETGNWTWASPTGRHRCCTRCSRYVALGSFYHSAAGIISPYRLTPRIQPCYRKKAKTCLRPMRGSRAKQEYSNDNSGTLIVTGDISQ